MSLMAYAKPAAFMLLPHLGGFYGGIVTRREIPNWYTKIRRPPWTPPKWVFPPVWTSLYTAMGYASYLVYKEVGLQSRPMYLFGAQLALNWIWTPLFFGQHRVGLAALDLFAVWGLVAACVKEFWPISETASRLMMPYLAWATLAGSINVYIWLFNDSKTLEGKSK